MEGDCGAEVFFDGGLGGRAVVKLVSLLLERDELAGSFRFIVGLFFFSTFGESVLPSALALVAFEGRTGDAVGVTTTSGGSGRAVSTSTLAWWETEEAVSDEAWLPSPTIWLSFCPTSFSNESTFNCIWSLPSDSGLSIEGSARSAAGGVPVMPRANPCLSNVGESIGDSDRDTPIFL